LGKFIISRRISKGMVGHNERGRTVCQTGAVAKVFSMAVYGSNQALIKILNSGRLTKTASVHEVLLIMPFTTPGALK